MQARTDMDKCRGANPLLTVIMFVRLLRLPTEAVVYVNERLSHDVEGVSVF